MYHFTKLCPMQVPGVKVVLKVEAEELRMPVKDLDARPWDFQAEECALRASVDRFNTRRYSSTSLVSTGLQINAISSSLFLACRSGKIKAIFRYNQFTMNCFEYNDKYSRVDNRR